MSWDFAVNYLVVSWRLVDIDIVSWWLIIIGWWTGTCRALKKICWQKPSTHRLTVEFIQKEGAMLGSVICIVWHHLLCNFCGSSANTLDDLVWRQEPMYVKDYRSPEFRTKLREFQHRDRCCSWAQHGNLVFDSLLNVYQSAYSCSYICILHSSPNPQRLNTGYICIATRVYTFM